MKKNFDDFESFNSYAELFLKKYYKIKHNPGWDNTNKEGFKKLCQQKTQQQRTQQQQIQRNPDGTGAEKSLFRKRHLKN